MINDTLVLIPARKGSKGVPNKNSKTLHDKPLISYTLELAIECYPLQNIFVSTDDPKIIKIAKNFGIEVPFLRPEELCSDESPIYNTIIHTIDYFEHNKRFFNKLILLQPTSPFRQLSHINEANESFEKQKCDVVVSVVKSKANPYLTLYKQSNDFIKKFKKSNFYRRQDAPNMWELNGSIFLFDINSLKKGFMQNFKKIIKYEMNKIHSIDIDDEFDWNLAELYVKHY